MTKRRVALAGATGRMGDALLEALSAAPDLELAAAFCAADDPRVGQNATPALGVLLQAPSQRALEGVDVVIDFTVAKATLAFIGTCAEVGVPMVIGTTGFDDAERLQISDAANSIGVVLAPNMSVGVNLSMALLALAARTLPLDYDVDIVEMHHRNKIDAPSGTALMMGEVVAKARGSTLSAERVAAYQGVSGPRRRGSIGFAALRGGDVVGDHTAVFAGDGERIEITHRSSSRRAYADGALKAARFVLKQPPGLYSMRDVLGLEAL
jgi:4-hydroxy-tetrahydrodipicolinate reductase